MIAQFPLKGCLEILGMKPKRPGFALIENTIGCVPKVGLAGLVMPSPNCFGTGLAAACDVKACFLPAVSRFLVEPWGAHLTA
jgi:hypothetical protein